MQRFGRPRIVFEMHLYGEFDVFLSYSKLTIATVHMSPTVKAGVLGSYAGTAPRHEIDHDEDNNNQENNMD